VYPFEYLFGINMATTNSYRSACALLAEKIAQLTIWRSDSSIDVLITQFPPLNCGLTAAVRVINHWRLQQMKTDIVGELSKLFLNIALTGEKPNWTEIANQLCADPPPPLELKDLTHEDVLFAASLISSLVKLKGKFAGEKHLWDDWFPSSRALVADCYKLLGDNPVGRVILSALLLANENNYAEVINSAILYCTAAVIGRSLEEWHVVLVTSTSAKPLKCLPLTAPD
jgi:hypothetical protein